MLALVLAAGALWGASSLTWVEVPRGLTVDGRMADDLTGADLVSWPVPLALLALAAVPALL
ncbi:Trp biosynthesis-associated membrane protein, partial [Saccharomonospora iraqiensis]|uniref:Trp biosynthesis-associated membrane protein n=1 Tax=Saccharomonospora iraqiensis TaxID=52698 RepID=UPI001F261BB5